MRKSVLVSAFGLAGASIALAALPWWAGVALRPIARLAGASYEHYERRGYSRFALTDVVWARKNVRVEIARAETDTPVLWLWRRVMNGGSDITATGVRVVAEKQSEAPKDPNFGMVKLHDTLVRVVAPKLRRWLPRATVHNTEVRWPRGGLTIGDAEWESGRLTFRGLHFLKRNTDGVITVSDDRVITVDAHELDRWRAKAAWRGENVDGDGAILEQPVRLSGHFHPQGWFPAEALVEGQQWNLPAATLKLDAAYASVRGSGRVEWKEQGFGVSLHATTELKPDAKAPPLEAHLEANGDRNGWRITTIDVRAPFATASLTAPLEMSYDGNARTEQARLKVSADLSKQSWINGRGTMTGTVEMRASSTAAQGQDFSFSADGVEVDSMQLRHLAATGSLRWPRLEFSKFEAQLDEKSRVAGEGACDLRARKLEAVRFGGKIDPAWLTRWLPKNATWSDAEFSVNASGPLASPEHHGEVRLRGASFEPLKPTDVDLRWSGHGFAADEFTVHLAATESTIDATGAVDREKLRLTAFTFAPGGREALRLNGPAVVTWAPRLRIQSLKLLGAGSSVLIDSSDGPKPGLSAVAIGIPNDWGRDWVEMPGPSWLLQKLEVRGDFSGDKLAFRTELSAELKLKPRAAHVSLTADGDGRGVRLTALRVIEDGKMLTEATGHFPIVWDTKGRRKLRIELDAPFELQLETDPASPLWSALGAPIGLGLEGAAARAKLTGTLRQPEGELHVDIASIAGESEKLKRALPKIEGLSFSVGVNRKEISLEHGRAKIEGQLVSAEGHFPMDEAKWEQLWSGDDSIDWRDAEATIEIPDAQMAPLAERFPDLIANQGRLSAHVDLAPGGELTGHLRLSDAATRPIPPLGVVQEIQADLALKGRTVEVRSFSGKVGGQPIVLAGTASVPEDGPWKLAMSLKGENVPLVRQTGLLVRTDFDLRADSDASGATKVTGAVNLRDCLLLSDLSAFLTSGQRGVRREPPYFSVAVSPFRTWQLGVEVRGNRSVRARTAVFKGNASMRFQLSGTLGDPRAIGELTIDQGQVLFPFATFDVQLGVIRLQEADPYNPQISATAMARRYGYTLRMEASGSPESPNITFTSNPALDSTQLLLMVMTGQKPTDESFTTSGQQRLTRVGAYFGQELVQGLRNGDSEDRLEISSGEQISLQGHETYQIEYKLSDRWSLVGEYDEFDDYNAGLKWRVYREGGARGEK
jgi:translocation and assembly module TamB